MNTKNQTTPIRIRGYGSGGAVQGMLTTGVITQSTGLAQPVMTKCYQLRCKNNSTLIKVQLTNYKIKINNVNEMGRTEVRRTNRKNFHQSSRVFTAKNLETHAPLSTD